MAKKEAIKIFAGKNIRMAWDDEEQEWYFSVVDVCGVLTEQPDYDHAKNYWKVLKFRLAKEGDESVTTCNQLKLVSPKDGKRYKTDVASPESIFSIIHFLSSPKEELFKQWARQIIDQSQDNTLQLSEYKELGGEIVLYQADGSINLEVRLEDDTVWLTQAQIIELFQSSKGNISEHINNIFEQGELEERATVRDFRTVQKEGDRMVTRTLTYYNLDVIISVGFRVNAKRGVRFRQWANRVLKDYLLRGYAINQRLLQMEQRLDARLDAHIENEQKQFSQIESTLSDHQEKIDFFVRTNQPPVEGIFYDGQIFDAYAQIIGLIKQAKQSITLIDNYVDETTLTMLSKRDDGVAATIYTRSLSQQQQLDLQRHNQQYAPITVNICQHNHDRFLIIDNEVYLFGASLKDAGKKLFAYIRMQETSATELVNGIR